MRGPALTWDDLARIYDESHSIPARIQPMDRIFAWAEAQTTKFVVDSKEGTIHCVL